MVSPFICQGNAGMDASAAPAEAGLSAESYPSRENQEQQQDGPVAKHLGDLQPIRCEYIAADEVLVSMRSNTGGVVSFSMKTAMLLQMVNLSVTLINNCTAQVFRDLDVF
jgi:hypothetical protein